MNDSRIQEAGSVSVLMPVFNEETTVSKVLQSVLAMECVYEVIVVDDGSADGTWDRIWQESRQDHRIRPLRHEVN